MTPEPFPDGQPDPAPALKKGYADYMDSKLSTKVRAAALAKTFEPASEADAKGILAIAQDQTEDISIRALGLSRLARTSPNDPAVIEQVIDTLKDQKEPVSLRLNAVSALRQLGFTSTIIQEYRSRYLDALRATIQDPDQTLRRESLEMLSQEGDAFTRDRLLKDLKGEEAPLLPVEKTIQLLGYDTHTDVYPVLRDIAANPPSDLAQFEAVRVLSADPGSAGFLAGIYRDKEHNPEVRAACGVALRSLAPAIFEEAAKEVAVDPAETDYLRAASITGLQRYGNPAALSEDKNFNLKLMDALDAGVSSTLENAVKSYQAKIPME